MAVDRRVFWLICFVLVNYSSSPQKPLGQRQKGSQRETKRAELSVGGGRWAATSGNRIVCVAITVFSVLSYIPPLLMLTMILLVRQGEVENEIHQCQSKVIYSGGWAPVLRPPVF